MSDKNKKNVDYKIIKKEEKNKTAVLEIEIPYESLLSHREKSVKALGEHVEIKGFRKGSAPTKMVEEHIGDMTIMEEMAQRAIYEILPLLVEQEKIEALTQPRIAVTKIAKDNPLVFKAEFILMPEITLPDYKKIAKSVKKDEEVKLEDKEVEEYIEYLRNARAEAEYMKKKTSADPAERELAEKAGKAIAPEFNDDFVKTLGNFKDVDDFKKQLSENMLKDKKAKAAQKVRLEIIEKIISESKCDIPDILIDEEIANMMHQFKHDLENAKINFEDYMKEIKKTEEEMKTAWRPDAEKRVKMNLIIPKIAIAEKIEADPKLVEHEVKHLKEHYKDISDAQATSYVAHMLRNDAVFKFLEEIK